MTEEKREILKKLEVGTTYSGVDVICRQYKEIERLNNIIKEFEEELKWQRKVSLSLNEAFAVSRIDTLINKLKELKGSGNNE